MGTNGKLPSLKRAVPGKETSATNRLHRPPKPVRALVGVAARPAGSAMFSPQAWEEIARSLRLSVRELQIVRGVFEDQKELTIASALGISVHTIHTHVERLHYKLAVADRTQLVQRVMQEFLALTVSPENILPPICANQVTGRCPLRPSPAVAKLSAR